MEGLTFLSELSIFIWPPAVKNEIWAANIVIDKNNFNDKRKREVESAIYCVVILRHYSSLHQNCQILSLFYVIIIFDLFSCTVQVLRARFAVFTI